MVFDYLPASYRGNMIAREEMHYAQCLAGMAFSNALLGIVHSMAHKTGAAFFLLSKLTGAAARMYIVCLILQQFIFSKWHVPFPVTVLCTLTLIWLYTRKSGIRTIVWTDTLQTLCLLTALVLLIINATTQLNLDTTEALSAVCNNPHSRIFEFSDWAHRLLFYT